MDVIFNMKTLEEFKKALYKMFNNWSNSDHMTADPSIKAAKDELVKLIIDSNFETNKIPKLLVDKAWPEERIALFTNLFNDKKTELLYTCLIRHNSEYGDAISNFDWHLKLVMGTSELNMMRYPLLQLILYTDNNSLQNNLVYEINKDMLLKTINALEIVNEKL